MLRNIIAEQCNAPGTATAISLAGALPGRATWRASGFTSGSTVFYFMEDGTQSEWGIGTFTLASPDTLSRNTVLGNSAGTTAKLNFTTFTRVYNHVPAERMVWRDQNNSLRLPDGSLSNPSTGPSSDPDTGIYFPAVAQVAVVIGGARRMLVENAAITMDVPVKRAADPSDPDDLTRRSYTDQMAPPGAVMGFLRRSAPTGWLKANGALVSRTTYAALFAAICPVIGNFTVTIASPGVVTLTAHGLANGDVIRLSTTGALPTGLNTTTDYYVRDATADTFRLALTAGGAAINTTGSQSGTHTARAFPFGAGDGSTTFALPDLRGTFLRGWDDGRGLDSGRLFGSSQSDAIRNITGAWQTGHSLAPAVADTEQGTGAFRNNGTIYNTVAGTVGGNWATGFTFDASRSVPTASENRPVNTALLYCIKY